MEEVLLASMVAELDLAVPARIRRLPVAALTRAQKARELERLQRSRAMLAAYEAELVLGLAADTPDTLDPPPGSPGARSGSWAPDNELPGVSEFFVPELAAVLNSGRVTATRRAVRAWVWRESLPATFAALGAGAIDETRATALAAVLQHAAPEVARRVEERLLPRAAALSVGRLRARATALLLEVDPEGAGTRRRAAECTADVRVHPAPADGMATLIADLPAADAAADLDVVDRLAGMLKNDGDTRPIGRLRAAVLHALISRPWDTSRPAVTAHLQVVAPLASLAGRASTPGEVDGLPITAAHLRALLTELDALGVRAPEGGSVTLALTDDAGGLLATTTSEALVRLARRGCSDHPAGGCGCAVLGRPPAVDRYEPTDAQRRWVRTRDRTCRFPDCGRRVGYADLDHVVAHADGGETCCTNLCCLCRSHHRLKTFARGWRFRMDPDGTLHVTTPAGITRSTRPPGLESPVTGPAGGDGPPDASRTGDPPPF
jgi:hypothetical protein